MLIRIENFILNTDHIAAVEILEGSVISLWLTTTSESGLETYNGSEERLSTSVSDKINFSGASAKALIEYFESPDRVVNLTSNSEEIEDFYAYQAKGGTMNFEDFSFARMQHRKLNAIGKPSDRQFDLMSELEHKLLY